MELAYYAPAAALSHLIGSYYEVRTAAPEAGPMRAEGPNFRCLIRGSARIVLGGVITEAVAPALVLIGPTTAAYEVSLGRDTLIFGAGLTPEGWFTALGEGAADLADRCVPYEDHFPKQARAISDGLVGAPGTAARVATADALVTDMAKAHHLTPSASEFVEAAMDWLDANPVRDVCALAEATGLSLRQVERLAKVWFGASPKLLQRKYRALRTCDRLAADPTARWQDIADPSYTDQSHMIREFRQFIGCTPGEFRRHEQSIVRETLAGRALSGSQRGVRFLA